MSRPGDDLASEAGVAPTAAPLPEPDAAVVGVAAGGGAAAATVVDVVVVEEGSSTLSIDTAVPEAQFTGLPPTARQVVPVTWMSRVG